MNERMESIRNLYVSNMQSKRAQITEKQKHIEQKATFFYCEKSVREVVEIAVSKLKR